MSQFVLTIRLGNAEMQELGVIANALVDTADDMVLGHRSSGTIFDINGNTVGSWEISNND